MIDKTSEVTKKYKKVILKADGTFVELEEAEIVEALDEESEEDHSCKNC